MGKEQVRIAAKVCERRLMDLDDLVDNHNASNWILVTDEEWEILSSDDLSAEDLRNRKHNEYLNKIDSVSSKKPQVAKKKKKVKKDPKTSEREVTDQSLHAKVSELMSQMNDKYPQFDMNGDSNSWIVKPAGLSRGRGIACYNTLVEILDHFKKEGMWVIQKYIENPMVVLRKKFDIRQWVMVTDWNPLTVWFYERCYCRFGVEDFKISDLSNKFIHLTNNSIVKHSENFYTTEIEGSMWHSEEFAEYLMEQYGSDLWEEQIKPKIKNIVTYSLECVQDMMDTRKNSFELFGYDIMLDENLNPWLIEINSSPAMDYSTQVTKELVKEVLEDCIKVMIDYNFSSKKKRKGVDTGNFSLIYKAKRIVDRPIQSFGLNLMCEGKAMKY